jgi:steroid delta-isomerase-like uncharacterized protein
MNNDAAEILRRWFQLVWVEGKTELIEALAAPDVQIQGLDGSHHLTSGAAGFRAFYDQMHASFSEFQFTLHDVVGTGPTGAARWTMRLRHTGDGAGVPATGKAIAVSGMTFIEVADGRIVAGWNEWDRATLLQAIGVVPPN